MTFWNLNESFILCDVVANVVQVFKHLLTVFGKNKYTASFLELVQFKQSPVP